MINIVKDRSIFVKKINQFIKRAKVIKQTGKIKWFSTKKQIFSYSSRKWIKRYIYTQSIVCLEVDGINI